MLPTANLAYRYLAVCLMLHQVNWFCETLMLPRKHAFAESDMRQGSHVGPPIANDFSGSILTDEYFFGFDGGHLANFYKRSFMARTDADVKRQNVELLGYASVIDTNGAYDLATNCLGRVGVDLDALRTNYSMTITQRKYYPKYQPTAGNGPVIQEAVTLPIYFVEWSGVFFRKNGFKHNGPVVQVTVSGITKEILEYHVNSERLFKSDPIRIQDLEGLLAISDEEFNSYNELQRSNLVIQYSTVRPVGARPPPASVIP